MATVEPADHSHTAAPAKWTEQGGARVTLHKGRVTSFSAQVDITAMSLHRKSLFAAVFIL